MDDRPPARDDDSRSAHARAVLAILEREAQRPRDLAEGGPDDDARGGARPGAEVGPPGR
jgi:hypothetical protein